ncbi:MAG: hypothetical protein F6J93_26075 [Oscillatoria sp. SIO1A7]|nr:hypothetical protein [Oscillatoria sp. SIO1A7]
MPNSQCPIPNAQFPMPNSQCLVMSKANILELASQGHPKAIAILLHRELKTRGVTVKTALKNDRLHIVLEAEIVPERLEFFELVRNKLTELKPEGIHRVKVYGRKPGQKPPAWNQEFGLDVGAFSRLIVSQSIEDIAPSSIENYEAGAPQKTFIKRQYLKIAGIAGAVVLLIAGIAIAVRILSSQ